MRYLLQIWFGILLIAGSLGCANSVFPTNEKGIGVCDAFTCVTEVDSVVQEKLKQQGKRKLQIYLIRHAKPNVKKKCLYSAKEVREYDFKYDSASVVPFGPDLVRVNLEPNHIIYCSSLPRSQETALLIFGDRFPVVSDSVFREFETKTIQVNTLIKMPLPVWKFFNRATWLLGFNHGGIESRKQALLRAGYAADNLIKVACQEETAVLVAHGMLNGAIKNKLRKKGWQVVQQQGHLNLGATILVKTVDISPPN